jgi:hypothetical protein
MPLLIWALCVAALLAAPSAAAASCVPQSAAEQRARAEVIVDGVIQAGSEPGETRVHVSRYLKGAGPRELAVAGAGGGGAITSVDVQPLPGERWRLLGRLSEDGRLITTACDGSARVEGAAGSSRSRAPSIVASSSGPETWWLGVIAVIGVAGLALAWPRRSIASPSEPRRGRIR